MCHPCVFAFGLLPLLKPWLLEEVSGTCIWGVAKNLHSPCNTTSNERLADSEDGIAGGGFHIFCSQSCILRQWHKSSSSWLLIIYIQWRCLTIHRVPLCNHCPWIRRFLFAILLQPGGAICLRNHGSLGFRRGTEKQPQGERQRQTERQAATERAGERSQRRKIEQKNYGPASTMSCRGCCTTARPVVSFARLHPERLRWMSNRTPAKANRVCLLPLLAVISHDKFQ